MELEQREAVPGVHRLDLQSGVHVGSVQGQKRLSVLRHQLGPPRERLRKTGSGLRSHVNALLTARNIALADGGSTTKFCSALLNGSQTVEGEAVAQPTPLKVPQDLRFWTKNPLRTKTTLITSGANRTKDGSLIEQL